MGSLVDADLGPAALDGFLAGCRRFARGCHFRQLALHVIATRLDPHDLTDLHDLFTAMDADGCGRVTFKQLHQAMEEAGAKMAEEELGLLFDALDIDHDGVLQYTDFLAAALEHQAVLTEARIRAAFEFFDADADGVISLQELRRALKELLMDPGMCVWWGWVDVVGVGRMLGVLGGEHYQHMVLYVDGCCLYMEYRCTPHLLNTAHQCTHTRQHAHPHPPPR